MKLDSARYSPKRRASVRFPLSLPVIFSWGGPEEHTAGGFTQNVSVGGAFVLSERCPPPLAEIKLDVMLQSLDNKGSKVNLQCRGRVTRVVEKKENAKLKGFAVAGCFNDDDLMQLVTE